METLIESVLARKNIILTSLHGIERSRFLLRNELALLAKVDPGQKQFSKIFHVCDKDRTINRLVNETNYLPLAEFGVKVAKYYCNETDENKSNSYDDQNNAQLIFCTLKHLITTADKPSLSSLNAIIVIDSLTLENIESTCTEVSEQSPTNNPDLPNCLPALEFKRMSERSWSVILACNPPIDGIDQELGCQFPVLLTDSDIKKVRDKTFATLLTHGPQREPLTFESKDEQVKPQLHAASGRILEDCIKQVKSGPIVIFFPSYGRMVEYHHAWQKSGLWERLGLAHGRENRGGDHFKNGLIKLTKGDISIFLLSIRYHQDEVLAEFVLSLAKLVFVVGIPYPFTNDTWEARFKYNERVNESDKSKRLTGCDLFKYRGIDFMNGVLKRCLCEFPYRNCSFFILDAGLENQRSNIAKELGDETLISDTYENTMKLFEQFCQKS